MPEETAFSLVVDALGRMGIPTTQLTEHTHLAQDLNLDSIEFTELAAALTRRCGLQPGTLNLRLTQTLGEVTRRLAVASSFVTVPQRGRRI
jgi:acyl carrier protein